MTELIGRPFWTRRTVEAKACRVWYWSVGTKATMGDTLVLTKQFRPGGKRGKEEEEEEGEEEEEEEEDEEKEGGGAAAEEEEPPEG